MNEMQKLVEEINKHSYNYYVLDNPTISDKEFDALYDRLVKLEKETGIILPNSPTQRVGGEILQGFEKYPHKERLYSLDKCQTKEALGKWIDDIKKDFPKATFTTEYKFDGLSLVATYKNGLFQSAGTRGNGFIGEDVTAQAKTIKSLPLQIDFKGELIVQGEAMITLSNLEKFNQNTTERLKNARNAAAGALRNLDPKKTAERGLDWFTYTIHFAEGKTFETQAEMMDFLKQNGFNTGTYFNISKTKEEVFAEIDKIDTLRQTEDILLDGVVVRLNQIAEREDFGFTAKFPKWAMAYKFDAEEITSILEKVEWQVGRTGKLTPIAIITPVELAGASISRATLNNFGDIQKKGVKLGSRVFVRRSNEVIPEILGLAEDLQGSKEIDKPLVCPSCGTTLTEIGANLFCLNKDTCKEQVVDRLANFASQNGFDIEGLSFSTIEKLYDAFKINKFHELFEMTGQEFMLLEGFDSKGKRANKLIMAMEKSKTVPFDKFLFALGIGEVGTKTAKDLANKFDSFETLKNASFEEILAVRNIGEVVAQNIYDFFNNEENLNQIQKLFDYGVKIIYPEKKEFKSTIFDGKTVVLTGTLNTLTRKSATELLESLNATVTNTISKNTNFLIAGINAGSKLSKAEALGVKILTEQEFLDIIA